MSDQLETRTDDMGEPKPPIIAGDHSDDDATYLDMLVESHAEPPEPGELPKAINDLPQVPLPKKPNRLMCRTGTYNNGCAPIMVLPPDPFRTSLGIISRGSDCYFADNAQVLQSAAGIGMTYLIPAGTNLLLAGYTGAVYLAPLQDGLTPWTYSVIGITE